MPPLLSAPQALIRRASAGGYFRRFFSGRPEKAEFVEIEGFSGSDSEKAFRRLDEAIHSFFVTKSAPTWLPFIPGSSYWVPPRKASSAAFAAGVMQIVTRISNPLTKDEANSFSSVRGWPSSDFYLDGRKQEDNLSEIKEKSEEEES